MSWLTMNEYAHGNHGPVIVKTDSGMIFPITSPKKGILQGHLSRLRIICYLLPRFPQLADCSSLTVNANDTDWKPKPEENNLLRGSDAKMTP